MNRIEITSTSYHGMEKKWYERLCNHGYAVVIECTGNDPRYWLNVPDDAGWDYLLKLREDLDHEIILTTSLAHPIIEIYDDWRE